MIAAIYGRMRRGLWFVAYPVAAIAFVAVVSALVRYRGYGSSEAIYLVTGIVLLAYTIETWRLRREAQLQTELQARPVISLRMRGALLQRRATMVNVGRGLAWNIRVADVVVNSSLELRAGVATHMSPGEEGTLPFKVWMRLSAADPISEVPMEDAGWNVGHALEHDEVVVTITYASIVGQWYETRIQITQGAPQIVGDRRRAAPSSGRP
jgi:hypothetical protein